MSKHVGEKCGKLHITYILSSQRGITPSKIDAKWRHSNLICSTFKQSHVQNFNSICQSMYEKSAENGRTETRTDGRRVGHRHTIIRPVWRRAYKKATRKHTGTTASIHGVEVTYATADHNSSDHLDEHNPCASRTLPRCVGIKHVSRAATETKTDMFPSYDQNSSVSKDK